MRLFTLLAGLAVAAMLGGCGSAGAPGPELAGAPALVAGQAASTFGFGAEGGTAPAVLRRSGGEWLIAYVGTNVRDRKLYWASSPDGETWSAPRTLGETAYSDQAPCLAEGADGAVHLYFASNRDGHDFGLYHARFERGAFGPARAVPGYAGLNDLAVTQGGGRFLLAAEVRAAGLLVATSPDGEAWGASEPLAAAGFEPTGCFTESGAALVAYQRSGTIFSRHSEPGGGWSAETKLAVGSDRLRDPAIAWAHGSGRLVYSERTSAGYKLAARRIEAGFVAGPTLALPAIAGEARMPALSFDHNGKLGLAWGMKSSSGQQGIVFARMGF